MTRLPGLAHLRATPLGRPSPRRFAAAGLAALAVLLVGRARAPAATATVPVWVAAHDLTAGTTLAATDVVERQWPAADAPTDAIARAPTGAVLAAPMRRGEPLTDVRLLGPALLAAAGVGLVAVPVRLADGAAAAAVARAGDLVDVLSAPDPSAEQGAAAVVATRVRVLTLTAGDGSGGGLLVVAASYRQAEALAAAQSTGRLAVMVEAPGPAP